MPVAGSGDRVELDWGRLRPTEIMDRAPERRVQTKRFECHTDGAGEAGRPEWLLGHRCGSPHLMRCRKLARSADSSQA